MSQLPNKRHELFARKIAKKELDPTVLKSPTKVYSEVYGTQGVSAQSASSRLLTRVEVQERIYELINKDVPFNDLSKTLKKHLKAKRIIWVARRDTNGIIMRDHKGEELKVKKIEPDYPVQEKALEKGLKVYRAYGSTDRTASNDNSQQVHFHLSQAQAPRLIEIANKLIVLRSRMKDSVSPGLIIEPETDGEG